MTEKGTTFTGALDRCGLSQRAFIRLVAYLGNGRPPPTVSTVNRWSCGHLETPGYAFAILALYNALSPEAQTALVEAANKGG